MSDVSRRDVVRSLAVLGAAPAVLSACARRIDPARTVPAPPPVDGVIDLPLGDVPELAQEGGAVVLDVEGAWPILVMNARAGADLLAVDGTCTHAQCPVTWVPEDRQIECPCHGSRFASDGSVLNPPAVEPLFRYPVDGAVAGRLRVVIYPGDGTFPAAVGGKLKLDLTAYPALQQPGGAVHGRAQGFPHPLLVRNLGGTLTAINLRCPHLGCEVHQLATELRCFCHDSRFEPDGTFIPESGPADASLAHSAGVRTGNLVEFTLPA